MAYKRLLQLLLLLSFWHTATAQPPFSDTVRQSGFYGSPEHLYTGSMGSYKSLYNGTEYIGSYPGTTGNPYFEWDTLQPAFIQYTGVQYQNIGLKYDLVSQEVVLRGRQNLLLSLVTEKIAYFSINGHLFLHMLNDSSTGLPQAGYYEVLYGGRTTVLALRKKQVERAPNVADLNIFRQYNQYFVKKASLYHPVDSEKSLLNLFELGSALKKQLRENKLRFKKAPEQSIIKAVTYYDQLKN